ncbi:type IV secretory system conjugative DNA transfer family protein [Tunicatimonas pelagia]|uniref:type IV secretory system conjugative DNA transfer family protein n=1 Tax=Tunicatimonas pelagia TaxID=931531 RepID=UPI0026656939|nr:type IV secretory system conjugative DNA transfer family protein [Tunicatimonas pelagia]WKN44886.1 type IV secretory system conjugative DNA transfer family protein [Tunicatimonas pelagia]
MPTNSFSEWLGFGLLLLIVALGVEYYWLSFGTIPFVSHAESVVEIVEKLFVRFGVSLRCLFILLYALMVGIWIQNNQQVNHNRQPTTGLAKVVWSALLSAIVLGFLTVQHYRAIVMMYTYPVLLGSNLIVIPVWLRIFFLSKVARKEQCERRKAENEDSLHIRTTRGWINVPNPFRGTLIVGSSGSGKSASIGNAYLHQFVRKGYCGVFYDFKFPTLANQVNTALYRYGQSTKRAYYIVNFQDSHLSHRFNPLVPENIATLAHAEEYARAIVNNLDTNTIRHKEFFSTSATAWLAALIWFFRSEHPQRCTLPHVINTALYQDYTHVISMLEANPQSADMVRSIATAIRNKADKQTAGVIASLQIMVTKINSPEIVWVLTGNDFDMDINSRTHPKLLCLGSDPSLADTFSPVISLVVTVALKQMNRQGKQKSFVLLDEAPTLYIPKFEVIPATARSNHVASVYMAQDFAQMHDMFGREKAEVIIANLSNQFYGKVSSVPTAKAVSEMIGKEERPITGYSQGNSRGSRGNRNISYNTNTSLQERFIVRPEDVIRLQTGEFVGQTVETTIPYFWTQTIETTSPQCYDLAPFVNFRGQKDQNQILSLNFKRVRREVSQIIANYPNIYRS